MVSNTHPRSSRSWSKATSWEGPPSAFPQGAKCGTRGLSPGFSGCGMRFQERVSVRSQCSAELKDCAKSELGQLTTSLVLISIHKCASPSSLRDILHSTVTLLLLTSLFSETMDMRKHPAAPSPLSKTPSTALLMIVHPTTIK